MNKMLQNASSVYVFHISVLMLDGGEIKRLSDGCDEGVYEFFNQISFSALSRISLLKQMMIEITYHLLDYIILVHYLLAPLAPFHSRFHSPFSYTISYSLYKRKRKILLIKAF